MLRHFGGEGVWFIGWRRLDYTLLRRVGNPSLLYLVPTGQAGWHLILGLAYHPHPCYASNLITALKSVP